MTFDFQLSDKAIASIIEASPIGMLLINEHGQIVFANAKAEKIFGYKKQKLLELSVEALLPERYRHTHIAHRQHFANQTHSRPMGVNRLLYGLSATGREIPIEVGLSPLELQNRNFVLVSVIDVSERERLAELEKSNKILAIAANRDELTGLPNRRYLNQKFPELVHDAVLNKADLLLFFIDLDGFKAVNDQHGHELGDQLLIKIAMALKTSVRTHDVVARIGGDEFVMCLSSDHDSDTNYINTLADKLLKKISSIKQIEGKKIDINASIGIVRAHAKDDIDVDALLRRADELMYQAKCEGKGHWLFSDFN